MQRRKKAAVKHSHRAIIGDARLMPEIEDGAVRLVVASPPVWQPMPWPKTGRIGQLRKKEHYINSMALVWIESFRALAPGCRLCVHIGAAFADSVARRIPGASPVDIMHRQCVDAGFIFETEIIRTKENAALPAPESENSISPRSCLVTTRHEAILVFKKPGNAPAPDSESVEKSTLNPREARRLFSSVWPCTDPEEKPWSPFPEEIPRRLIKMYSFTGETVLDPFAGGGTTAATARDCGRSSVSYEIDPTLEPVIRERVTAGQPLRGFTSETAEPRDKSEIEKLLKSLEPSKAGKEPKAAEEPKAHPRKAEPVKPKEEKKEVKKEYTVADVLSPDMLRMEDGTEVRLAGVNVPTTFFSRNRGLLRQALGYVGDLVKNGGLTLEKPIVGGKPINDSRRYVYLRNGEMLNTQIIRAGFALSDRPLDHARRVEFDKLEDNARRDSIAIWALGRNEMPRD